MKMTLSAPLHFFLHATCALFATSEHRHIIISLFVPLNLRFIVVVLRLPYYSENRDIFEFIVLYLKKQVVWSGEAAS